MTLYLIRHAQAGQKSAWSASDSKRPLSVKGEAQAEGIAEAFDGAGITRVISSPLTRCRQTVQPLAGRIGAPVELDDRLAEGASVQQAIDLVRKIVAAEETAALCSHGDVIPEVIQALHDEGLEGDGHLASAKGGTFLLDTAAGQIVKSHYVPPPEVATTDTSFPKRP